MDGGLFDLRGKTALVTGSSRGLGLTLARGLAEAGAAVVLNARDAGRLGESSRELEAAGHRCRGIPFDVTRPEEVERGIREVEEAAGPLDILVNNAGVNRRGPTESIPVETWHEVIATNLTSAFLVSREVGRRMIGRRAGKIINMCSLMSEVGRSGISPYSASKGGLRMLTRNLATEWARHNIQVNGIGPGYFLTEMTRPLAEDPEFDRWIRARTPAQRWGRPEELVGAAVFLASRASDFVNGQILYIDGGILAAL